MTHPDLPAEQAYLDKAYECLDRMRETLKRVAAILRGAEIPFVLGGGFAAWANGAPPSDHEPNT